MGLPLSLFLLISALPGAHASSEECSYLFADGPLWSFLDFFKTPEAIRRAENIQFLPVYSGTGLTKGKRVVGRADGTPFEKYAYRIEKVTGYRVTLSKGANEARGAQGFVHDGLTIVRNGAEEKIALLNLNPREAGRKQPSYIAVHESSHAWFGYLDRIGEGTPLSVTFQDFGNNYSGPYSVWMSAQELKTWSQDVVRVLRKESEVTNLRKFEGGKRVRPAALFGDFNLAIEKLEILAKLSERSETDLIEALHWLRSRTTFTPAQFDLMVFNRKPGNVLELKDGLEVILNQNRKIFIPINTVQERTLVLEAHTATPARAQEVHRELLALWIEKLENLRRFNRELYGRTGPLAEHLKAVQKSGSLNIDEYTEVRQKLAEYGNLGRSTGVATPSSAQ